MTGPGHLGSNLAHPALPPLVHHFQRDHFKSRGSFGRVGQFPHHQGNDSPRRDTFFPWTLCSDITYGQLFLHSGRRNNRQHWLRFCACTVTTESYCDHWGRSPLSIQTENHFSPVHCISVLMKALLCIHTSAFSHWQLCTSAVQALSLRLMRLS